MNDVIRLVLNIASKNKIKQLNIKYHKKYQYNAYYNHLIYFNFAFNYRLLNELYKYHVQPPIYNIKTCSLVAILPKNY